MADVVLMTQEGYDKLEAERDELVSVRRKEVSEKLKEARSYGDLSENAEYGQVHYRWFYRVRSFC